MNLGWATHFWTEILFYSLKYLQPIDLNLKITLQILKKYLTAMYTNNENIFYINADILKLQMYE